MAFFTGGSIPTIRVSNNTLIDSAVTGIAGNLAETGISVALSPVLGAELSNQLGLDPNASFGNLGGIISNGVVSSGEQYLNQIVNEQIVNSKALGPFGPLVGGIAQNAVSALSQGVSGLLSGQGLSGFGGLAGLFGGGGGTATTASAPNNTPSRAFPGAGDEPYGDAEADYGGNVYNMGSGGPDVVFSIKPAMAQAAAQGASELANPLVGAVTGAPVSLNGAAGNVFSNPTFKNLGMEAISAGNLELPGLAGSLGGNPNLPINLPPAGTSSNLAFMGGVASTLKNVFLPNFPKLS